MCRSGDGAVMFDCLYLSGSSSFVTEFLYCCMTRLRVTTRTHLHFSASRGFSIRSSVWISLNLPTECIL